MSNGGLPLELGRAVDDKMTKNRHQIFSIDYDSKKSLYVLHYSVCSQDLLLAPDQLASDEFIETLSQDIIDNPHNTKASARNFSQFMQKMRRGVSKNQGYKEDKLAASVTYDIGFNGDYDVKSFNVRATQSVMTRALDNQTASSLIEEDYSDDELKVWHDFALHTRQDKFYEGAYKATIDFSTVTDVTTDIIKLELYKMAVKNKIDCVCRHSPFEKPMLDVPRDKIPRKESIKTLYYQYGSILNDRKGEPKRIENMENKTIISATASRNSLDAYNQIVLKEFLLNNKTNTFPPGTAYAIAHYRDQLNEIRRTARLRPAA